MCTRTDTQDHSSYNNTSSISRQHERQDSVDWALYTQDAGASRAQADRQQTPCKETPNIEMWHSRVRAAPSCFSDQPWPLNTTRPIVSQSYRVSARYTIVAVCQWRKCPCLTDAATVGYRCTLAIRHSSLFTAAGRYTARSVEHQVSYPAFYSLSLSLSLSVCPQRTNYSAVRITALVNTHELTDSATLYHYTAR